VRFLPQLLFWTCSLGWDIASFEGTCQLIPTEVGKKYGVSGTITFGFAPGFSQVRPWRVNPLPIIVIILWSWHVFVVKRSGEHTREQPFWPAIVICHACASSIVSLVRWCCSYHGNVVWWFERLTSWAQRRGSFHIRESWSDCSRVSANLRAAHRRYGMLFGMLISRDSSGQLDGVR